MEKAREVIEGDIKLIVNHFLGDKIEIPDNITEDEMLWVKKIMVEQMEELGDLQENREKLYKSIIGMIFKDE